MKKVTLLGEDSDDSVERENVWVLKVLKDTESNVRWVMPNETRGYEVVLVCAKLENARVDLENMRMRNVALKQGSEVGRVCNGRGRGRVKKCNNGFELLGGGNDKLMRQ